MKRSLPLAMSLAAAAPVLLLAAAPAHTTTPVPAPYVAEAQVRSVHEQVLEAFSTADTQVLERLVAQDFFAIDVSGDWLEHQGLLASRQPPGRWREAAPGMVEVRVFADVALVEGVLERGERTAPERRRYTEGYHWRAGRWQLVHLQHTALREGVAAAQRVGTMPTHAPWVGTDPGGGDNTVLHALNDSYVRAFREADVAWYDEHLATGYGVVNSDGSFDDRARALEEFALPVFAQHLKSFPVGQVRVRRFGDTAFIHAENDFERKDGKRGINRYTDVWHRQWDGRWRCVSAHITTYRVAS